MRMLAVLAPMVTRMHWTRRSPRSGDSCVYRLTGSTDARRRGRLARYRKGRDGSPPSRSATPAAKSRRCARSNAGTVALPGAHLVHEPLNTRCVVRVSGGLLLLLRLPYRIARVPLERVRDSLAEIVEERRVRPARIGHQPLPGRRGTGLSDDPVPASGAGLGVRRLPSAPHVIVGCRWVVGRPEDLVVASDGHVSRTSRVGDPRVLDMLRPRVHIGLESAKHFLLGHGASLLGSGIEIERIRREGCLRRETLLTIWLMRLGGTTRAAPGGRGCRRGDAPCSATCCFD